MIIVHMYAYMHIHYVFGMHLCHGINFIFVPQVILFGNAFSCFETENTVATHHLLVNVDLRVSLLSFEK